MKISYIIKPGAKGADFLGKRYAEEMFLGYIEFLPDWDKFGKSAGYRRNFKIINEADYVIAFWDGKSKGTKHSIDLAKEQSKPFCIVKF